MTQPLGLGRRHNLENTCQADVLSRLVGTRGLQATQLESLRWGKDFPVCQTLKQHHIVHVGIQDDAISIRVPQSKQTDTCFLACYGGKGKVLINGQWQICKSGFGCLLPSGADYAFESIPGVRWQFCWVSYGQTVSQPIASMALPVMARFETLPLRSAINGLLHEFNGAGQPALIQTWTSLVHTYVSRFAESRQTPDSLGLLWERLVNHLSDHWTLSRLAREAGYSSEHLRRLCRAKLGRSPMQQVSHLRMRRAAELLTATDHTIEVVAHEVGYQNAFVFSNAFTKRIGWRPSEYRRKSVLPPGSLKAA
jgi:AraC-like DNA-binding protein